MESQKTIEPQRLESFFAFTHKWSIVIIAIGLSLMRNGNESGNVVWSVPSNKESLFFIN